MMNLTSDVIFDPWASVIAGAVAFVITAAFLSFPAPKKGNYSEAFFTTVGCAALVFGVAIAGEGTRHSIIHSESEMLKSEALRVYDLDLADTKDATPVSDLLEGRAIFINGQYIILDRATSSLLVLTDTEPLPAKK